LNTVLLTKASDFTISSLYSQHYTFIYKGILYNIKHQHLTFTYTFVRS